MRNQRENLDTIFKGAPSSKLRKPLDYFVRKGNFKRYVIPFAGRFAAAATIASLGINPQLIETSGISLFSSVLGYYFSHRPLEDLKIRIRNDVLSFLPIDEEIDIVTSTLYGLKYFQLNAATYYMQSVKQEYLSNWKQYWNNIKKQIQIHADILNGIKYEICDAELRLASGIDPSIENLKLEAVKIPDFEIGFEWHKIGLLFLPFQLEKFEHVISSLNEEEKVFVADLKYWESFKNACGQLMKKEDIKSIGQVIARMSDIVLETIAKEQLK